MQFKVIFWVIEIDFRNSSNCFMIFWGKLWNCFLNFLYILHRLILPSRKNWLKDVRLGNFRIQETNSNLYKSFGTLIYYSHKLSVENKDWGKLQMNHMKLVPTFPHLCKIIWNFVTGTPSFWHNNTNSSSGVPFWSWCAPLHRCISLFYEFGRILQCIENSFQLFS